MENLEGSTISLRFARIASKLQSRKSLNMFVGTAARFRCDSRGMRREARETPRCTRLDMCSSPGVCSSARFARFASKPEPRKSLNMFVGSTARFRFQRRATVSTCSALLGPARFCASGSEASVPEVPQHVQNAGSLNSTARFHCLCRWVPRDV